MNIKSLKIKNFKCFKEADIDFRKITLLTGANSSGKSSLISVLLSIFQTDEFPFYLSPNGFLINLGNYRNMVNGYDIPKNIELNIKIEIENPHNWNFSTIWENNNINGLPSLNSLEFSDSGYHFNAKKINSKYIIKDDNDNLYDNIEEVEINFGENYLFTYNNGTADYPDFSTVRIQDLFNFINSFRTNPQRNYLQIPKAGKIQSNGAGFENQLIEWEESNSPKILELVNILTKIGLLVDIKTNKIGDGMFDIKIQTKENGLLSSLADVGYGVSKLLPIIVADLQLPDNSLLAISEPELDLHPSIQANFANYIFEQTKKGKQYIIETHSEYIINRLRLLIAKNELKENEVKTYFFSNDGRSTKTYSINLKKDGRIENAPKDFFDTYEIDIMDIAMLG